jgi:hypothetical protein
MDVFTMVAVIVIVSVGAGIAHDYMKTKRHETSGAGAEVRAELEALRERVRVLEEIVTDERYHLNAEITRLERRDRPA